MNKTLLVAAREFLENVRTKTFWIGIMAFPVLFVVAIVVTRLMQRAKDVHTYAVLDRSEGQWLSQQVEQRLQAGDLQQVLRELKKKAKVAPTVTPVELRAAYAKSLADLDADHAARPMLELMTQASDAELEELAQGKMPGTLLAKLLPVAMRWAQDPDAQKQLKGMVSRLSAADYHKVEAPTGEDAEAQLNQKIQKGELFAYFIIGSEPLQGSEGCKYVSNNLTDHGLRETYSREASEVVEERRIAALKAESLTERQEKLLALISKPLTFTEQKISAAGAAEEVRDAEKVSKFAPVAFVYFLWIAVFTAAQMLLTNTIEEKSNRLIEVLLSSVSPLQLMVGKVLGIAATGLTVVGSWVICALIGVKVAPGMGAELARFELATIVADPRYLCSLIGYFLAGYLLFAAILVGIGSVCNSLKESQHLVQPVFLLLMVPLLAMIPVVQEPNGTLARVLTYIPLFTPFLMMNRAGGPPPAWEYGASTALILVSLAVAFWGAAKIFRVGILMTGKPPKLREIFGWLRAPIGAVAVSAEPEGPQP